MPSTPHELGGDYLPGSIELDEDHGVLADGFVKVLLAQDQHALLLLYLTLGMDSVT